MQICFKYKLLNLALLDLDVKYDYIVKNFKNVQGAENFLKKIYKAFELLGNNPYICPLARERKLRNQSVRKYPIGDYVALYRIDEKLKIIDIIRVFHQAQNYIKQM
ncbi:MAG: type II toxin-antitoxin system RelE/ParE family toxin [Clostridiales bacterium]|jgi:addiction module RelE/StbE family toxin|nr:type II toxin-antitoxin system RelE/ParE family toxin [Clostridiales bacterium]